MSRTIPSTDLAPPPPRVDPRERLKTLSHDALDRLEQLMWNQRQPSVAMKAVETVLDRVIPKETKHAESRVIRISLEHGEKEAAKRVLEEAAIIDVEAEVS